MNKKVNVLIIASDPITVADIKEFGNDHFEQVEVVYSAEDALDIHEKGRFDIIYMDITTSEMSAIELIKNIKNYDINQQFIVLIDEKDKKNLFSMIQHDVFSFMIKPIYSEKFTRITNKTKALLLNCNTCDSLLQLQNKVQTTSHQNDLKTNILIQQSKLAQTGEMISMIAHQWRQPLSAITAITGTIRTQMDLDVYKNSENPYAKLEHDVFSAFERIEESADFLSKTVNDFRNFYRPETGISQFYVFNLIESVCRMALLDKDQLNIDLKLTMDKSIQLNTFENELKQVLINIINNAKDAFIEKKVVKPRFRISLKQGGSFIYINLTDNAGGIDPEIMDQIFLPYFSTKSEKNGTGIGLYMSKVIIENHIGGVLSMSNNLAFGGADFCIQIPSGRQESIG